MNRNGVTRTVKVADLTGNMSGNCPLVRIVNNVEDRAALAQISSNPGCYSLIEKFPGGFTPQFGAYIDDYALAGGLRGELGDWYFDLSAAAGRSNAEFYIYNTINPQLLGQRNDIDIYYEAGAYTETDRVVNIDLSRPLDIGNLYGPVNLAVGFEYRDETFKITNGEPNSFYIDPNLEHGLSAQGFGIGSNGFPGFQPGDAGSHKSSSIAAYIDLESNVTDRLLLGAALRYEDYKEFGDTLDVKGAVRFQVAEQFALRGAVSTGFRVPTAGQANLRNVTTEFNMGFLADIATLPPTNPVAQQKGAEALTPEESVNITVGAVFNAGPVDITLDYYNIEIKDRIAFTSRFSLTPEDIATLEAAGVSDARSFTSVRFFSNQQKVKASGIDLVATLPFDLGGGVSTITAVANWSDIDLTETIDPDLFARVKETQPDFTGFVSENRRLQIEEGRPDTRFVLTWTHLQGPWRFMARGRYYGEYYDAPTNNAEVAYNPDPKFLVDLEASYDISESVTVLVGAQNAFDTYPEKNPKGNVAGLIYPESSPFGFNGGYYYVRAMWRRQ